MPSALRPAVVSFFVVKQKTAYEFRISDLSSDVCSSDLERLVDRRRRFAEPFRSRLGHKETILEPYPELAGDIDAGFVRKAHAGRELCRFAAHEVDRLVPVEPDPVKIGRASGRERVCPYV